MTENETIQRCGYVALVGRPNVGKSTLLNHLLGQKLSITSRKPQTTRHRILGIKTEDGVQTLYVDTPGIHADQARALNRAMNRTAAAVARDVDVIVFVIEALRWTVEDELVLSRIAGLQVPVIVAINKVDQVQDKDSLLPFLDQIARDTAARPDLTVREIVPISALKGGNLPRLESLITGLLPAGVPLFPDDQITDRSMRFVAAEMVREKITRQLGQELPYSVAVEIERFAQQDEVCHIDALILVERGGQKAIVIGKGGDRLKKIGVEARMEIERLLGTSVMLKLWVKVRSGWSDDERALRSLGFIDRE
jgi:GTP-binding protein Era